MKQIRLEYQHHKPTGLFAATSPDVEGFLVVGNSVEELLADIPAVAGHILSEQAGEAVAVAWSDLPDAPAALAAKVAEEAAAPVAAEVLEPA